MRIQVKIVAHILITSGMTYSCFGIQIFIDLVYALLRRRQVNFTRTTNCHVCVIIPKYVSPRLFQMLSICSRPTIRAH